MLSSLFLGIFLISSPPDQIAYKEDFFVNDAQVIKVAAIKPSDVMYGATKIDDDGKGMIKSREAAADAPNIPNYRNPACLACIKMSIKRGYRDLTDKQIQSCLEKGITNGEGGRTNPQHGIAFCLGMDAFISETSHASKYRQECMSHCFSEGSSSMPLSSKSLSGKKEEEEVYEDNDGKIATKKTTSNKRSQYSGKNEAPSKKPKIDKKSRFSGPAFIKRKADNRQNLVKKDNYDQDFDDNKKRSKNFRKNSGGNTHNKNELDNKVDEDNYDSDKDKRSKSQFKNINKLDKDNYDDGKKENGSTQLHNDKKNEDNQYRPKRAVRKSSANNRRNSVNSRRNSNARRSNSRVRRRSTSNARNRVIYNSRGERVSYGNQNRNRNGRRY